MGPNLDEIERDRERPILPPQPKHSPQLKHGILLNKQSGHLGESRLVG